MREEEETVAYAIMEKADDNLGAVLRRRPLDAGEMRELLDGLLPALEFLHAKGYVHSRVKPANVLACGNTVKLSSDRVRSLALPRTVVEPPGLYDAPETGGGQFSPASDVYSLSVLILEALTGAPVKRASRSCLRLSAKSYRAAWQRDPKARWTLHKIRETLLPGGRALHPIRLRSRLGRTGRTPEIPKLGVMAVAGALVAGAVARCWCEAAHQAPQPPATPAPMVSGGFRPGPRLLHRPPQPVAEPASMDAGSSLAPLIAGRRMRKAREIDSPRPPFAECRRLSHVAGRTRYLVILGESDSQADAKRAARRARSEGAPRGVYVTHERVLPTGGYSWRIVCIASVVAARRAGVYAAASATAIRETAPKTIASGPPSRKAGTNCSAILAAANAIGIPIANPQHTSRKASRITIAATVPGVAPSAIRTPISFIRRATDQAISPYSPRPARIAPIAANPPESPAMIRSGTMDASICAGSVIMRAIGIAGRISRMARWISGASASGGIAVLISN